MIRLLRKITEKIVSRIGGLYQRKAREGEWDDFLLGRYQEAEAEKRYRWYSKKEEERVRGEERVEEEEKKREEREKEYRHHEIPELEIETKRIQPGAKSKEQRRRAFFENMKKTGRVIGMITLSAVLIYIFWYSVVVFILRLAIGQDCGYRKGLYDTYKECHCVGRIFKVRNFWESTSFCVGVCRDCKCWQLQMTPEVEGQETDPSQEPKMKVKKVYSKCSGDKSEGLSP